MILGDIILQLRCLNFDDDRLATHRYRMVKPIVLITVLSVILFFASVQAAPVQDDVIQDMIKQMHQDRIQIIHSRGRDRKRTLQKNVSASEKIQQIVTASLVKDPPYTKDQLDAEPNNDTPPMQIFFTSAYHALVVERLNSLIMKLEWHHKHYRTVQNFESELTEVKNALNKHIDLGQKWTNKVNDGPMREELEVPCGDSTPTDEMTLNGLLAKWSDYLAERSDSDEEYFLDRAMHEDTDDSQSQMFNIPKESMSGTERHNGSPQVATQGVPYSPNFQRSAFISNTDHQHVSCNPPVDNAEVGCSSLNDVGCFGPSNVDVDRSSHKRPHDSQNHHTISKVRGGDPSQCNQRSKLGEW
ncbi:hypothetical protein SeLEV6574_g06216 [Synchytrium endobioticum]|uniref:Uncharacterized protein n=1 Tax=Synchytrium endobioticum TaxID=286115 RepID=A0A507CPY4_9FUNG|nr:hypothetical protein SeLEV6574_g06216 [Synchytrium endobioticum]